MDIAEKRAWCFDRICGFLKDYTAYPADQITESTTAEELGLDTNAVRRVLFEAGDQYDFPMAESVPDRLHTVGDAVDFFSAI